MLDSLFSNSTLPMLEQVVGFTQARHGVLAGNIANLDTPGYHTRDLSPEMFEKQLKQAVTAQHAAQSQPIYPSRAPVPYDAPTTDSSQHPDE